MGFTAALAGALAHDVLHLDIDGVLAPSQVVAVIVVGGLPGVDHSAGHVDRKLRILAKGHVVAGPAGFSRQVNLGADVHGQVHGMPFLGQGTAIFMGQFRIEGGGQRQVAGPVGHAVAFQRVGNEGGGDSNHVGICFDVLLNLVVPGGNQFSANGAETDVAITQIQRSLGGIRQGFGRSADAKGVHFQAQLEFQTQAAVRDQVAGAFFVVHAPVFKHVQFAVTIQILEGVTIHFNQIHAAALGVTQGCAAFIFNQCPAFRLQCFGILLAAFAHGKAGQHDNHHHGCDDHADYPLRVDFHQ